VLGEGILLALAGVGLGAAVAWVAVERLSGFLAGAPARDPTVFAGVAVGLVAVVVGASLRPALTAARVAPAEVLREG
jgi:ABC-type antimicrobial peptide transport system permease subunit